MAAKLSQRFLAGIILCLFAGNLFAFNTSEMRGFDEKVFDYYFDRADRETDPSSWMREARQGIQLAIAGWEAQALEFYADPDFRLEAGQELIRWSEEELEKRYAQWLFKRFFGASSGQMAKIIDQAVDNANRLYAYHTDDAGNIIYDETGAPQSIRPSDNRSVETDRMLWSDLVARAGNAELQNYKQTITSSFPELLSYIDEDKRSRFEEYLAGVFSGDVLSRQAEFDALLAREERLFVARRTGDIWSRRRQSENQSAALTTSQLIREAESSCALGIASLEERIEAAKAGTGGPDFTLAGEEWLAVFQEQFDRGLKAWADAEERFIVRRMEWERDSGERFLEGEETWENAFAELEKERIAWENKAWELFNDGETLFKDVSEKLTAAIKEAREEFEKDAELRTYGGAEQAKAWVDMYVTCASVLAEAESSVAFWLSRFVDDAPENALENGTLGTWVQEVIDNDTQVQEELENISFFDIAARTRLRGQLLSIGQKTAGEELIRWAGLYTQYQAKALEAIEVIEREFGLALSMDKAALNAVLGLDSEGFFLDEYQVELLRAKAVAGYWEKRLVIAEAVYAYAEDISAGRMTEAESLNEWRAAKAAYDDALTAYGNSQEQLKTAGNNLAAVHTQLQTIAAKLAEAEQNLNELGRRYGILTTAYEAKTTDLVLNELAFYYAALVELSGTRLQEEPYYTAYLKAEIRYAEEYVLRDGWALLKNIVLDDTDPEMKKLQLSFLCANSALDWYYAVSGKEETPEDRQALEAEGLFKRLMREAEEERIAEEEWIAEEERKAKEAEEASETERITETETAESDETSETEIAESDEAPEAEKVPVLAREMLFVYQNLIFYAPGLQKEIVEFAWRSLSGVFAGFGVSVTNRTLPDIVSLSERLLDYGEENTRTPGSVIASLLADIDSVTGMLPMMLEAELSAWKDALIDYMAANVLNRGIAVPEDINEAFENYESLIVDIYARLDQGEEVSESDAREVTVCQYLLTFLVSCDNYRKLIETAPEGGRKHWRSYANTFCLETPGYEVSWEEEILEDAREAADEAKRRIDAAFALFGEGVLSDRQMEFISRAGSFLEDPEKAWEDSPDFFDFDEAEEIFLSKSEEQTNKMNSENFLKQQIAALGYEYSIMPPLGQETLDAMKSIFEEMEKTKKSHQLILEEYSGKASEYANLGGVYETYYGETKKLFADLDNARNEYEKQDAIQRWAGTSYLSQSGVLTDDLQYYREPAEELAYARERTARAQSALAALQDLYKDGETNRAFADSEYMALYEEYQESFSAMFLTLKAKTEFAVHFEELRAQNKELYEAFYSAAFEFLPVAGQLSSYFNTYSPETSPGDSWRDFIYITASGELCISRDKSSFALQQLSQSEAAELAEYFKKKEFSGDGTSQMSDFETALAAWAERMAGYNLGNLSTYQNWGLALDFLLYNLEQDNPDIEAVKGLYEMINMGADGNIKLDGNKLQDLVPFAQFLEVIKRQQKAWNSLNALQRADLEFLAAMILAGGGGEWAQGLKDVSKKLNVETIRKWASGFRVKQKIGFVTITVYHPPYFFDHSEWDQVMNVTGRRITELGKSVNLGMAEFSSMVSENVAAAKAYNESCAELTRFSAIWEEGVEWIDIESILSSLGTIEESEIATLKGYWLEMLAYNQNKGNNVLYTTIVSALESLHLWKKGVREDLEQKLQYAYLANEQERRANQNQYRITLDAYINGECTDAELRGAAELAYGTETAALKNHYFNLGTAMLDDLKTINTDRSVYTQQYQMLADQYVSLVERAYGARFNAELAAREIEWNEQKKDLNNKLAAWREAAGLILERGRQDWKTGYESMGVAYAKWQRDFLERYAQIDDAWNAAYLESLQGKELWINEAVNAASGAYNGSVLALIGSDAEAGSRKLDGFMPSSFMDFGCAEEASAILQGVLESAGIVNLRSALTALTGSANTVLTQVRKGVSGLGTWNSSQSQATAKELARNSTNELASGRMAMLAFQVRETVYEAKRRLEDSVVQSNKGFDDNMDRLYLVNGGWRRSGNSYIKDIIVHSTVFTSAITEAVAQEAYKWFVMASWDFSTDLSDAKLQGLDYSQIQNIASQAHEEVSKKSEALFGVEGQGGAFQQHVGKYDGAGEDQKSGEYGRLMFDFFTWEGKQEQGIALMNAALWDKPLWDSRESWFKAPSIRSVVDTGVSIVATVVGAALAPITAGGSLALAYGINMADDLLFGAMDVTGGYKSWEEAGVSFGKKALISAAASAGGALFSGAGTIATGVTGGTGFAGITSKAVNWAGTTFGAAGRVAAQTGMAAVQSFTIGTATSALSAITYSGGKFGWDSKTFTEGLKSAAISSAVAGTGAFTTGMLNYWNVGDQFSKLTGFSTRNKEDVQTFNSFVGGLAGQGVNYAFTGDFSMNILNLGDFFMNKENSSAYKMGLVEFHFGKNGTSMNLGSGGMDAGYAAISGFFRGLEVLDTNLSINKYVKKNDLNIPVALRTQYGFGDATQKEQLKEILRGDIELKEAGEGAEFGAKSVMDNGKKVIYINEYSEGMDDYDQMRLGVVLGHEAYRDGYGGYDFDEFKTASIARIMMGDRINNDYSWFYERNEDFSYESDLLFYAEAGQAFDEYLLDNYHNEEDYYWRWVTGVHLKQNGNNNYLGIPLLNALSKEEVDKINNPRLKAAMEKYREIYSDLENYEGTKKLFTEKTDSELRTYLKDNKDIQRELGLYLETYYSLYMFGCVLFSAMYAVESVTGKKYDPVMVNEFARNYIQGSAMTIADSATLMTALANGEYQFTHVALPSNGVVPTMRDLEYFASQSNEEYISRIRVQWGNKDQLHTEMVAGIVYEYAIKKYDPSTRALVSTKTPISIKSVQTTNPWGWTNPNLLSTTCVPRSNIVRWDVFKVTRTNTYNGNYDNFINSR